MRTLLNSIQGENMPYLGHVFTCKKLIHSNLVNERLDRVIGHADWLHCYTNFSVVHKSFYCFDHFFIVLNTNNISQFRKGSKFRFQNH